MPSYRTDAPMLDAVVPLKLTNKEGVRYERLPAVETELGELVGLPTGTAQQERLAVRAKDAPGYTHPESVAYFVRECHGKGNNDEVSWLYGETLGRCERFIVGHLSGLYGADRDEAHDLVVDGVFRALFDLERPAGEYYQVRFWSGVNRRCIDAYDKYAKQSARVASPIRDGGTTLNPVAAIPDPGPLPAEIVDDRDLLRRASRHLMERKLEREAEAFALRYLQDYPIGEKGIQGTIAGHYNVSARTINNWINIAKGELRDWWKAGAHA